MKVKALVNFSGRINMSMGQMRVIEDDDLRNDLLNAGYVEEVEERKQEKEVTTETQVNDETSNDPEEKAKNESKTINPNPDETDGKTETKSKKKTVKTDEN